ncbi:MAG: class I SAM-dependent methyltransferase [Phycisphaerae bacterium]|jgi:predicted O-methyltransferase YrrM
MSHDEPFIEPRAAEYAQSLLPAELSDESWCGAIPADLRTQPPLGLLAAGLVTVVASTVRPRRMLEVGTSLGHGAIALGRAAQSWDGHLTTVEIDADIASRARANVTAAGLADTVTVVHADAREYVASVNEPYGLIIQDADKELYEPMLPQLVALLEPGGVLISDDVLFPVYDLPESARHWAAAIDAYNRALRDHPALATTWLPIGCGLAVSVRRR